MMDLLPEEEMPIVEFGKEKGKLVETFLQPLLSDEQKRLELKIAAFLADSASTLRQTGSLIDFINSVTGKNSASDKLAGTKCTKLITRVLGPGFRKLLLDDVGNGKYSLLIDESTDVATMPILCIVIRYLSPSQKKIITTFYRLIYLDGKDTETLVQVVLKALTEDGLDIKNLFGWGTDGANVLVAPRSGVYARLKELQPDLCLLHCVCQSLHKAAQCALKKLPCNLEWMVRSIYEYFDESSRRKDQYAQRLTAEIVEPARCQLAVNIRMHRSDSQAMGRTVKIFAEESISGDLHHRYRADQISLMMEDKNKAYLLFCQCFLRTFTDENTLFQHENVNVFKLSDDLDFFYTSVLSKFVVPADLRNARRADKEISEFQFEKHLCHLDSVMCGMNFQLIIDHISDVNGNGGPGVRAEIKQRCRDCWEEAARQVRDRLPPDLSTLRLLDSLSPEKVVSGKIENVMPLFQRFESLTPDAESAYHELNSLSSIYRPGDSKDVDAVTFWLSVRRKFKGRFDNIAIFALNLLCLPFSNASAERAFSAMALVKTALRNRFMCETVDSFLSVRYGLKMLDVSPGKFEATEEMLKLFTEDIYQEQETDEEELQLNDVYEALAALEKV